MKREVRRKEQMREKDAACEHPADKMADVTKVHFSRRFFQTLVHK